MAKYWIPEQWYRTQPVADDDLFEVPSLDGWKKTPVTNCQVREAVKILREVAHALIETYEPLTGSRLLGDENILRTYAYCKSVAYIGCRLVDIVHMMGDDPNDSAPEALRRLQKEISNAALAE